MLMYWFGEEKVDGILWTKGSRITDRKEMSKLNKWGNKN